jgi:hypothetical protein
MAKKSAATQKAMPAQGLYFVDIIQIHLDLLLVNGTSLFVIVNKRKKIDPFFACPQFYTFMLFVFNHGINVDSITGIA